MEIVIFLTTGGKINNVANELSRKSLNKQKIKISENKLFDLKIN